MLLADAQLVVEQKVPRHARPRSSWSSRQPVPDGQARPPFRVDVLVSSGTACGRLPRLTSYTAVEGTQFSELAGMLSGVAPRPSMRYASPSSACVVACSPGRC